MRRLTSEWLSGRGVDEQVDEHMGEWVSGCMDK